MGMEAPEGRNYDASHFSIEQKVEAFRVAMHATIDAARDHADISPEGAAAFYMTAVVAVRQLFAGEHPDEAMKDEAAREMRRIAGPRSFPWMN